MSLCLEIQTHFTVWLYIYIKHLYTIIKPNIILLGSSINRCMSGPERDRDPWACRHSNGERQRDPLLPGIPEEEERQRPHPTLVLFSPRDSHSRAPSAPPIALPTCTRALSVSHCEDGREEEHAVWELHPSFPPAEVRSVRGDGGRGVPAADCQCDSRDGPGFLQLPGPRDSQIQRDVESII